MSRLKVTDDQDHDLWFIDSFWSDYHKEYNLIDLIAANRGWKPLTKNEKMTVHFHGKEYEIVRKE